MNPEEVGGWGYYCLLLKRLCPVYSRVGIVHWRRITWNAHRCTVSLPLSLLPLHNSFNHLLGPPQSTLLSWAWSEFTQAVYCFLLLFPGSWKKISLNIHFHHALLLISLLGIWSAVECWQWSGSGLGNIECTVWWLAAIWQIFRFWTFHWILFP